ncbi:MAG: AAA family ATPase [Clostridium sp.]|nr:AAA family ATPase [Clostridium sp.]
MNIFKISYRVVRVTGDEIYKGFGFKHLSDATQYYVHPKNQSYNGTTTLCQPIGEAITLFSDIMNSIISGNDTVGDYYVSDDGKTLYLMINIPRDYRINEIVDDNIYGYKVLVENCSIKLGAYDENDRWIDGNMDHLRMLNKLLPIFSALLAREVELNKDFNKMFFEYLENPAADIFVNMHEDFYQTHKFDEYSVEYTDLSVFDYSQMVSCSSSYEIIKENIKASEEDKITIVDKFESHDFSKEYFRFIPKFGEEFELPKGLDNICSAITNGDIKTLLFHGPAGTGKTMSCKLICQTINLPILETINCTENLDEFVLGKFIPEEDKIIFKESYVTKAIRDGGAVVFEEINFARPQYLSFLNSLLDDNGFVRLDNGEVVKRHKNFRFFATMNFGYFGTKDLNQALYNRFNAIVEISELSDEAISKMLMARVPECSPFIDKLLSVYHKVKKKIDSEELDIVISPRNLENWARMAKYDGYIKAAERTIIPIAKCDRIMENSIRSIIRIYRWQ